MTVLHWITNKRCYRQYAQYRIDEFNQLAPFGDIALVSSTQQICHLEASKQNIYGGMEHPSFKNLRTSGL